MDLLPWQKKPLTGGHIYNPSNLIRLAEHDLFIAPSDAISRYGTRHIDLWTDVVRAVLDQSERPDLKEKAGPDQEEFVEYLESGVVERDFEELF